jgi:hypothetical protein
MDHKTIKGIRELIAHIEKCHGNKSLFSLESSSRVNPILENLYKQIHSNSKKIMFHNFDPPLIKEIDTYHKLTNYGGIDDSFIGKDIRDYIKDQSAYEIIYEHTLSTGETVTVFFIIPEFVESTELINKFILIILTWFEFIYPYATKKCGKKLDVFIYLTPFKKILPENGETIGKDNVNTAYTTSCAPHGKIVIYRSEEWFKVLIHETFHVLGLDFSHHPNDSITKELKKIFPVNSDIKLFEGYTEAWAEILNCLFVSYYRTKSKKEFLSRFERCMTIERDFSVYQMLKVLNYMNLRYSDLYSSNPKAQMRRLHFYKEESNVFAYYIITALLLFNVDKFLMWCYENNGNLIRYSYSYANNASFIDLISRTYRSDSFKSFIACVNANEIWSNRNYRELQKTMRMSIIDLIEN